MTDEAVKGTEEGEAVTRAAAPAAAPAGPGAVTSPLDHPAGGLAPRAWYRSPMTWIGFGISLLAVVTFATLFDMQQVGRTLLQVSWGHVAISVCIFAAAFYLRSLRWRWLLTPLAILPFQKVHEVLIIGYMGNLVLPARMGEVARALALWRVTGVSRRGALTTIGLTRLFDGVLMLTLLVVLGQLYDVPGWARKLTFFFFFFMGSVLTVALWLAFAEASFFRLMGYAIFFLPGRIRERIVGFFRRFAAGTYALRFPWLVLKSAIATVILWSLEFQIYLVMMRGFEIDLPAWSALLTLVVTNIGIAAPSAPGYVGVFEAACSSVAISLGINPELALSYAIGVHLMMYTYLVVTGQIFMWRLGLKLSDITH